MKTLAGILLALAAALFAPAAPAQSPEPLEPGAIPQAELDSILAPIALYPDSLLSQLLIAATYPRDVAEAAAWSRANPQLSGDEAVRAVDNEPWDPSVKSLVAFPQLLAMMDERMGWTERLGEAWMSAPEQVSETIQVLRARADRAGNLRSGEEIVVRRDYDSYVIEPAEPEVVYVPYYDPRTVYGTWWWPDYGPVWWSPWIGYSWSPGYAGFAWGYGIRLGSGFWFSGFDWPRRYIRFYGHRPHYYHGHSRWYTHRWYSDRDHRRNIRGWQGHRDWRYDGRRWDRDGRRDGRWDGRRDGRDGRWDGRRDGRDGRWDGRRDGRDGRGDGRRERGAQAPVTGIERPASSPRHVAPAPAVSGERRTHAPSAQAPGRGIERAPERAYVPRQAPAQQHLSRPVERAGAPAVRSAPPAHAPVQSPIAREERPARNESRPQARESRSESRSESRQESPRGGGGAIGRGSGGRSQQH